MRSLHFYVKAYRDRRIFYNLPMKARNVGVALFVGIMIAQSALILNWGEPYPAIALPRVAGTVTNQYDTLRTRHTVFVAETRSGARKEVSTSEIFNDAPSNIRSTIPAYLQEHLQYRGGTFLDSQTKNGIRFWLLERVESAGISGVQKIYATSIEKHHPICRGCNHSVIVHDTLSSTLLVNKE